MNSFQSPQPQEEPWIRRLFDAEAPDLAEKDRFWWRVWILRFLKFCRTDLRLREETLEPLAAGFLGRLAEDPETEDWKADQAREALRVFARGIENWHWTEGNPRPQFRVRTRPGDDSPRHPEQSHGEPSGTAATSGSLLRNSSQEVADDVEMRSIPADWRERMEKSLRVQHYAYRTEETYLGWAVRYVEFCRERHGALRSGTGDARRFLEKLALENRVAAGTQNQAFASLLFLSRTLWDEDLGDMADTVRARPSKKLPEVLSEKEIGILLGELKGSVRLAAELMYGCGLRVSECLRLRHKDIDLERLTLEVRQGKGRKDRFVMLPVKTVPRLKEHLTKSERLWQADRDAGLDGVKMPDALEAKWPEKGKTLSWYWLFPSKKTSEDPRAEGVVRRHHLQPNSINHAIRRAADRAGLTRTVTCHTLRHSFATHLLENGADARTVQELMGHAKLETTQRYLHVMKQPGFGVRSPLDGL